MENLSNEQWIDIFGYEGLYQVSNYGRVKSLEREYTDCNGVTYHIKGRIMKLALNHKGYLIVHLSNNHNDENRLVHRLVADAFIPVVIGKNQINHIDGNKLNNNVLNLEWCTNSENMAHAVDNGLNYKKQPKRVCKIDDKTGELLAEYESISQACFINGFSKNCAPNINRCCNHIKGYSKSQGYRWMYSEEYFGLESNGCVFCKDRTLTDVLVHSLKPYKVKYCPICRKQLNKEK